MQKNHTIVLENLATATHADIILVVLLTKTISEISTKVSTLTAKLAMAQSEHACLKISGHRSAPADHGHCLSIVQAPSEKKSAPWPQCLFKERAKIRPQRVLLISRVEGQGVLYVRDLLLPDWCTKQIGNADGDQWRKDMEQGLDQRRAKRVRGGRIR